MSYCECEDTGSIPVKSIFFRASSSLNGKTLVFETKNIGSIPMSYINKNIIKKTSDRVVIVEAC
jgi:hypothetical protein